MAWFNRGAHPEEQLSAYVDGELDARARATVQSHLTECEACSALVDELRQTKSMLAALPRQESPRSFALGPQYAVPRRAALRPSRFGFAPVAALTVLLALLFVDAADFSRTSSSDDSAAGGASTADLPTAARQAESAEKDDAGAAASDSSRTPFSAAGSAESSPNSGTPTAPNAQGASATPIPPAQDRAAPAPEESPQATLSTFDRDEDDSDGISTLRILEIVAALALVTSLGVIYLPRLFNR
jgi:anti-sigma factor RsiW